MCASNPARCSHLPTPAFTHPQCTSRFALTGNKFGWKLHYGRLVVDTVILLLLIAMASILKEMPEQQGALVPVAVVILVLMFLVVCLEFWTVNLWWKNNQGEGDAKIAFWTMFKNACRAQRWLPMMDLSSQATRLVEVVVSTGPFGAPPSCRDGV